ncbi:pyridine nucleotide-disulfide oxidoreductase-domain-containing protein [Hyaloraphidium curvatum]|nr:pyridine nucleotide-disulfide oxidoreductase-domain-containing protein [Hyaloraphidium curvatum]
MSSPVAADYLVIGAGAFGVVFSDALLSSNPDATIVLAERNDRPGGHWIHAYPFVNLHQPAANYGVASAELSTGKVDKTGTNAGLEALASGQEVEAHLKRAVFTMEGTGRLRFLPSHEWIESEKRLRNLINGQTVEVKYRKLVLANYNTTITSAMRPPPWTVAPGVRCVPSRELPAAAAAQTPARFCILGGGKTGMDCIVWMIERGVSPKDITWVIPRDFYAVNRDATQVGQNREMSARLSRAQRTAIDSAKSFDEALKNCLDCGYLLKLASATNLTAMHGAVISRGELALLDQVTDVERRGRVASIDAGGFTLTNGVRREMPANTIYVDCAAATVKAKPQVPIWQDGKIVIPFLTAGIPCFSAALIARLECLPRSDAYKNYMLRPSAFPDVPHEMVPGNHNAAANLARIFSVPELARWTLACRLSPTGLPQYRQGNVTDEMIAKIAAEFGKRRDSAERLLKDEASRGHPIAVEYLETLRRGDAVLGKEKL